MVGPDVQLVSTGEPVARQTRRLLEATRQLHAGPAPQNHANRTKLLSTGDLSGLQAAAKRWLRFSGV